MKKTDSAANSADEKNGSSKKVLTESVLQTKAGSPLKLNFQGIKIGTKILFNKKFSDSIIFYCFLEKVWSEKISKNEKNWKTFYYIRFSSKYISFKNFIFIFQGGAPSTNLLVLNEVVIDRGPSPYLSNIDLYLDGKLITSVQVIRPNFSQLWKILKILIQNFNF